MSIAFLDIDGVLHPEFCHSSKHFSCLPALEHVLRQVLNCEVVITSTWRLDKPFDTIRARFSADIAPRILGVTPQFSQLEEVPDSLVSYPREAECNAWLRANEHASSPWLAIDDRSWNFRPFNRSLFLVDGKTGLTTELAQDLLFRLQKL